jgi:hypothetical protein
VRRAWRKGVEHLGELKLHVARREMCTKTGTGTYRRLPYCLRKERALVLPNKPRATVMQRRTSKQPSDLIQR